MVVLWVASSCYSFSDTTYGTTNNTAANGLSWGMGDYLPDFSAPNITVKINGVFYQYTMNKDKDADAKVHVRNKHVDGGYIFEKTDDWSGKYGATLRKFYTFPGSNAELWGDGEMAVEGDGSISDASMIYSYRMDVNEEQIQCSVSPLSDPSCPGWLDALYKYLQENGLLEPDEDSEFYEAWLAAQEEAEQEEDQQEIDEEQQAQDDMESRMRADNLNTEMFDASQQALTFAEFASVGTITPYYDVTIPGGTYEDVVKLEDATLPDNRRALRNLANDANHRTMVRSQYDREQ